MSGLNSLLLAVPKDHLSNFIFLAYLQFSVLAVFLNEHKTRSKEGINKYLFTPDRALKTDQRNDPTQVSFGKSVGLFGLLSGRSLAWVTQAAVSVDSPPPPVWVVMDDWQLTSAVSLGSLHGSGAALAPKNLILPPELLSGYVTSGRNLVSLLRHWWMLQNSEPPSSPQDRIFK